MANNIDIEHNLFLMTTALDGGQAWFLQMGDEPRDVRVHHNTIDSNGTTVVYIYGGSCSAPANRINTASVYLDLVRAIRNTDVRFGYDFSDSDNSFVHGGPRVAAGPRTTGPVVAWGANRLDAFVIGTDRALYHTWWTGSACARPPRADSR